MVIKTAIQWLYPNLNDWLGLDGIGRENKTRIPWNFFVKGAVIAA